MSPTVDTALLSDKGLQLPRTSNPSHLNHFFSSVTKLISVYHLLDSMAPSQLLTNIYAPLPESSIRLLSLLPGAAGSEIHCSLTSIPLHCPSSRPYFALSYMWGPPEPSGTITLNRHSCTVRTNLFSALRVLRDEVEIKTIWIDAMCINQNDDEERSTQVAIMSDIYRQAQTVLVWLGEAEDQSTKLFDFLRETKGEYFSGSEITSNWVPENIGTHITSEEFCRAFYVLSIRPYWRRVWIIQEILSGTNVVLLCGNDTLPLDCFAKACERLISVRASCTELTYGEWLNMCMSSAGYHIAQQYVTRSRGFKLAKLIDLCGVCLSECEDTRDKIYGILSLASDHGDIIPDYSKSALNLYLSVLSLGCTKWTYMSLGDEEGDTPAYLSTSSFSHAVLQLLRLLRPYAKENLKKHYALPGSSTLRKNFGLKAMERFLLPERHTKAHPSSVILQAVKESGHWIKESAYDIPNNLTNITLQSEPQEPEPESCCRSSTPPDYAQYLPVIYHMKSGLDNFQPSPLWCKNPSDNKRLLLPASNWDNSLPAYIHSGRSVNFPTKSARWSEIRTKFLTLGGSLGIGPGNAREGDILCHIEDTSDDYVIIRYHDTEDFFELVGRALMLKPHNQMALSLDFKESDGNET